MLTHNSYFEGQVQSVGFERNGRRQSVGVIAPGAHRFSTESAERMTVISGEFKVQREGESAPTTFAAGTSFEVSANSFFDISATAPSAYFCEYL